MGLLNVAVVPMTLLLFVKLETWSITLKLGVMSITLKLRVISIF